MYIFVCNVEIRVVFITAGDTLDIFVTLYFCRLSDFLFVVARYAAMHEGKQETIYRRVDTEVNEKNDSMM